MQRLSYYKANIKPVRICNATEYLPKLPHNLPNFNDLRHPFSWYGTLKPSPNYDLTKICINEKSYSSHNNALRRLSFIQVPLDSLKTPTDRPTDQPTVITQFRDRPSGFNQQRRSNTTTKHQAILFSSWSSRPDRGCSTVKTPQMHCGGS